MKVDLSKVGEREKLKIQREPHWHRLYEGCFVGFRRSRRGGTGTWIARAYDEDASKYVLKALGDFGVLPGSERFAAAKKEAEAHADKVRSGGHSSRKIVTVAEACEEYAKTASDAAGRFKRHVYNDPIAKVRLDKLRRHHTAQWRQRLQEKPALVSRSKDGEPVFRERALSTVNRDMAIFRAALAKVLPLGAPNTEAAWQEPLKSAPNADGKRTLYLDLAKRKKLVAKAGKEAAPFVKGLCLLPFRPGALAKLQVSHFDKQTAELTVGKDKDGKPRRVLLPPVGSNFFTAQVKGKSPDALIFTRSNGKAWDKETWAEPIAEAAKAADLPHVVAYNLRHSTITDLVIYGLPLLTIAQISGTSVAMIEKHYGHLEKGAAVKALSTLGF